MRNGSLVVLLQNGNVFVYTPNYGSYNNIGNLYRQFPNGGGPNYVRYTCLAVRQ